jgi:hypothetical protein
MIGWPPGPGLQETLRYIAAVGPTTIAFSPPLSYDHPAATDVGRVAFPQSIRDLNNDGYVDQIGDISKMTGRFNTQGGNPSGRTGDPPNGNYVARFDFNNDSFNRRHRRYLQRSERVRRHLRTSAYGSVRQAKNC